MTTVATTKGKALLIIEREDSEWVPYHAKVIILSCDGDYIAEDCAREDIETCLHSLETNSMKRMRIGDRIWLKVVYELEYTRDYWGEHDVDLVFHKERVLKRTIMRGKHDK